LLVVGTGPLEQQLNQRCLNKQNIIFKGQQNKEAVIRLISKAKATVFPSIWHETFGLVIIESFSTGTPVLYNDINPIDEIVRDNELGIKFNIFNKTSLELAINNVEKNRGTLSKNCSLEFDQKYYHTVGAQKLEALFLETIKNNRDK